MPNPKTRWFLTAFLAAALLTGFTQPLDRHAAKPVDAAFERALVTFAVVRGINAIVSVVQGTEIAIEPAGVGVILTPGEVFDPVNDLIERFSWIMLAASTSLGAQKVLISIGTASVVQAVLLMAVATLLVVIWRPGWFKGGWRDLALRVAMLVLFVRFAVPVMVLANDAVYEAFLADRYQASYAALEQTRDEIEALQEAEKGDADSNENSGMLGRLERWYDRASENFDVDARIAQYKDRFARASEHIIHLIVVFLLQTVVFPLLFLWLGIRLLRGFVKDST
ncbi:MAG: hypothetical protein OES46_17615 [Gammaproteobacteria bacterium]|nr:hypothetical protein [Gammaproteobacteria bacterium]